MIQTVSDAPLPRATYRLQLNKDFTFAQAEAIAPYLGQLGISHVYLSPILKARAGSTHGYDTVDHSQINPELGTLEDFRQMAHVLRGEGIGIILDIVPNHMGVGGSDNPYWLDLLEWGRDSRYADWFDVNWSPSEPSLRNKVLAPFLGCGFGEAVESGRLKLKFDAETGSFAAWAEDSHKLPIDPRTYSDILASDGLEQLGGDFSRLGELDEVDALNGRLQGSDRSSVEALVAELNADPDRLTRLYDRQNWRAARYSVAADDINYRRFFIVSDLGAIRIEREDVFDHAHRLVFQLIDEGLVEGLRIDHIDGLYDPKQYALRLRHKCLRPIYLVVEKILAPGEQVRTDWNVDGTTGYEFANAAIGLLVDPSAEKAMSDFYVDFTGRTETLDEIERTAKLEILDYEMSAELDSLASRLRNLASAAPATTDLTRNGLRNGLRHFVASMQVYRTYVDARGHDEEDKAHIRAAIEDARKMAPTLDPAIFDFIEQVASGQLDESKYERANAVETAMRLQQFTGPAMAKGLEDTALYRFNRLIALSDVGQRPDQFGMSVDDFHQFNAERARLAPGGMLTSSSHDTKRGEDVRARIAALSLMPEEWMAAAQEWRALLSSTADKVDAGDLYYFFQQTLGSWPDAFIDAADIPADALTTYRDRSLAAMIKAVREARLHTTWTAPSEAYEAAITRLVDDFLDPEKPVLDAFRPVANRVAKLGARNSLITTALKLTVPGMPDIYQGSELNELSMVDPDNRRSVDFAQRQAMLSAGSRDLVSGGAKLSLIHKLLKVRADTPELFARSSYEPLIVGGSDAHRVIAFLRREANQALLVVAWLGKADALPHTVLSLPPELQNATWTSLLSEQSANGSWSLNDLLDGQPVAVLRAELN